MVLVDVVLTPCCANKRLQKLEEGEHVMGETTMRMTPGIAVDFDVPMPREPRTGWTPSKPRAAASWS
jgi:hypothetical protein